VVVAEILQQASLQDPTLMGYSCIRRGKVPLGLGLGALDQICRSAALEL
jgi:hypothetical protein